MSVTTYLDSWTEFLAAKGASADDVNAAFLAAVESTARAHYGEGADVSATLGQDGPIVFLGFVASADGALGTIPLAVVHSLGEDHEDTEVGGQFVLPACYTHHPRFSEAAEALDEKLAPHFDKKLADPTLWPKLDAALEEVLWGYLGALPPAAPGTLEARLREGLAGVSVTEAGHRIDIVDSSWRIELTSPTLRKVRFELDLDVWVDGTGPIRVKVANGLGWSAQEWEAMGKLPAASDSLALEAVLRGLAADEHELALLPEEFERLKEWGNSPPRDHWMDPILESLVAAPSPDSLFAWCAAEFAKFGIEGFSRAPSNFGFAGIEQTELGDEGFPVGVTLRLGELSGESLLAAAPDAALQEWTLQRLNEIPAMLDALAPAGNDDEEDDWMVHDWLLLNVVELCVKTGTMPEPVPPIPAWDELSIERFARRLRETPPREQRGFQACAAMEALRNWSGDVWPVSLAGLEVDGWRMELVGERSWPHGFTAILLSAPDSDEYFPVLWNDIWSSSVRWCVDGDRAVFQAFVDLLRQGIVRADLDARVDIRTYGHIYYSGRGRAEIRQQTLQSEPGADVTAMFAALDAQGRATFEERLAAESPPQVSTMMVSEWLNFEMVPGGLPTLDWRVDYPCCVGSRTIVEGASPLYGFAPDVVAQLAEDAPARWREFLKVVDPRLARFPDV